jgi:hypothetical protein
VQRTGTTVTQHLLFIFSPKAQHTTIITAFTGCPSCGRRRSWGKRRTQGAEERRAAAHRQEQGTGLVPRTHARHSLHEVRSVGWVGLRQEGGVPLLGAASGLEGRAGTGGGRAGAGAGGRSGKATPSLSSLSSSSSWWWSATGRGWENSCTGGACCSTGCCWGKGAAGCCGRGGSGPDERGEGPDDAVSLVGGGAGKAAEGAAAEEEAPAAGGGGSGLLGRGRGLCRSAAAFPTSTTGIGAGADESWRGRAGRTGVLADTSPPFFSIGSLPEGLWPAPPWEREAALASSSSRGGGHVVVVVRTVAESPLPWAAESARGSNMVVILSRAFRSGWSAPVQPSSSCAQLV